MEKLWPYLAIFAIGNVTGIILAIKLKLGPSNIFKGRVKLKNKRISGTVDTDISVEVKTPLNERKTKRKNRRNRRVVDKQAKKD